MSRCVLVVLDAPLIGLNDDVKHITPGAVASSWGSGLWFRFACLYAHLLPHDQRAPGEYAGDQVLQRYH